MSKWRNRIQHQFNKTKANLSQFVSKKFSDHEPMTLELDPHTYGMCKQIADSRQTTVQAVVNHALEQFIAGRPHELKSYATLEQKEKNPLLHLDALTININ